jgi:hypothetical protein
MAYLNYGSLPYTDTKNVKDLKPILLTEEWLLKFGFVKLGVCDAFKKAYSHPKLSVKIEAEDMTPVIDDVESNLIYIGESIKYVHQLQNIYFALTCEELILKQ